MQKTTTTDEENSKNEWKVCIVKCYKMMAKTIQLPITNEINLKTTRLSAFYTQIQRESSERKIKIKKEFHKNIQTHTYTNAIGSINSLRSGAIKCNRWCVYTFRSRENELAFLACAGSIALARPSQMHTLKKMFAIIYCWLFQKLMDFFFKYANWSATHDQLSVIIYGFFWHDLWYFS